MIRSRVSLLSAVARGAFNTKRSAYGFLSSTRRSLATAASSTSPNPAMFCFQCEQTKDQTGCTTVGVCGKTPDVASLQDLLVHAVKGVGHYASAARKVSGGEARDVDVDRFVPRALFTTLTNVNFDANAFHGYLRSAEEMKQRAKTLYEQSCRRAGKPTGQPLSHRDLQWAYDPRYDLDTLVNKGQAVGVLSRRKELGQDILGLQELVTYGLKGTAAYTDHARILGKENNEIYGWFHDILAKLSDTRDVNGLLGMALDVGRVNLDVMAMLDAGATERFGHPVPTRVNLSPKKGKCILVSGHDLHDLELVLKQTAGKNINVYTHGELLPAHGYPMLKKYPHLVGNYGGAWQLQKSEFASFPGSILVTTNCLVEPRNSYKDRIFTRGAVGWPGVRHLGDGDDMTPVIKSAMECEGFEENDDSERFTMTGFGRNAVSKAAGQVLDAIKAGQVKRFFLVGGCDGAEGERSYFRDVALSVPKDGVVLTLACGKYRFNKLFEQFGTVGGVENGLPRMMDIGQCNDAYSAVQIASLLAGALKTDVNGLPLSFVISWFEQKAVAVLLSLLHLNVKDIRLGPNLPAFVTPAALKVLSEKFGLRPIGRDVSVDVQQMIKEQDKKLSQLAA